MGTMSHHYGQPFGYRGVPGTCLWCGRKLRYIRVLADESDKADPTYQEEPRAAWATVRAVKPGGYQDGLFCGLRCGYQWAVRAARFTAKPEPMAAP